MQLVLVRHGATQKAAQSGARLIRGALGNIHLEGFDAIRGHDPGLQEQLEQKGRELAGLFPRFDFVYSSALFRTRETLEGILRGYRAAGGEVATGHPFRPEEPLLDFRINERDFGPLLSAVGHGISADDFFLKEAPARDWIGLEQLPRLKEVFPEQCAGIRSEQVADYLQTIFEAGIKGVLGVLIHIMDLSRAGVETTAQVQKRLRDFEDQLLHCHPKDSVILVGSHSGIMRTWALMVEDDTAGRYTEPSLEELRRRDADPAKPRYGSYRFYATLEHLVVVLA